MKHIFLTAVLFSVVTISKAQVAYNYLRAADYYYKNAEYSSAAPYYEKYLAGTRTIVSNAAYRPYNTQPSTKKSMVGVSSEQQAIYKLAESYRLLHNYSKAVPWYAEAMEFDKATFPLAPYHYAVALRALGRHELAEKAFTYFLESYQQQDNYRETAQRELQNLRFIIAEMNKPDLNMYKVEKAPEVINPIGANYAPVWFKDSVLVFTSTRPEKGAKGHAFVNRLYSANYATGQPDSVSLLAIAQPKDVDQGVIALSPDGNTLFMTRWTVKQGKKSAAIYSSKKSSDTWSEPVLLDTILNVPGYSSQQPFVTPDGKRLIYASDRPGGVGGFDLWEAELNGEGTPFFTKNLGPVINTAWNEEAPYVHAASNLLIFSTDGRVGMGGFDFFYSKDSAGVWSTPVNFGYPVNSVKDDMYFISKGSKENILENVWLSSDRAAACCLELFSLQKVVPPPPPPPPAPKPEPPVIALEPPTTDGPIVLENIYYDFNMSYLQPASFPSLDRLVAMLKKYPAIVIELSAHTDSKGSNELNEKLSEARAKSCVDYLVGQGIDASRLQSKGYAATRPIAPNTNPDGSDNPEGRARNRRTEFRIISGR
ncbi:OmpA family protein [Chitinophaga filiformis]|uniref:Outer membrane protein OmpA n=1 Tax=Chitinophaga filiformis TaxID=104663 RepID=A0A1G7R1E3_CHIFI|nr:OmpA family protein [Chitinophaga filiformis]SDG04621.1 Outer membrane protein OmpA [Chitinophaga filiformis]